MSDITRINMEIVAFVIVSIFCLGLSFMIAVGFNNVGNYLEELERSSTHPKNKPVSLPQPTQLA